MRRITAYTNTDTVIRFGPVAFAAGSGVTSLLATPAAVLDLRARPLDGGMDVIGSAQAQTVAGGGSAEEVIGTFLAYTLTAPGMMRGQLWAEKGGQRVMLAEFEIEVRPGYRPAAE